MALRQILTDEDETLRKQSREVTAFDERLQILLEDMLDTMYANNGIGLAAPQIGILRRIFVVDIQDGQGPRVMINPQIVSAEGSQLYCEGCLSVPGRYGEVERPASLVLEAQDKNGEKYRLDADGLLAVCISHENDHLDGVLFLDKVKGEVIEQ